MDFFHSPAMDFFHSPTIAASIERHCYEQRTEVLPTGMLL
jgi:hypothetical protein